MAYIVCTLNIYLEYIKSQKCIYFSKSIKFYHENVGTFHFCYILGIFEDGGSTVLLAISLRTIFFGKCSRRPTAAGCTSKSSIYSIPANKLGLGDISGSISWNWARRRLGYLNILEPHYSRASYSSRGLWKWRNLSIFAKLWKWSLRFRIGRVALGRWHSG